MGWVEDCAGVRVAILSIVCFKFVGGTWVGSLRHFVSVSLVCVAIYVWLVHVRSQVAAGIPIGIL